MNGFALQWNIGFGIDNASRWAPYPTQRPNATGFAFQWNLGLRGISVIIHTMHLVNVLPIESMDIFLHFPSYYYSDH